MRLNQGRVVVCGPPAVLTPIERELQARGVETACATASTGLDDVLTPEVDAAVVCVFEQPTSRPCHEWSLPTWDEQVTQPLRRTTVVVRELLSFWLGEGTSASVVLLHIAERGDGALVVRDALDALARSVAKEYGRRGVRCNVVGASALTSSVADVVGMALSPAMGFVTGQRFEAQP